jgi:GNAT superfamily N-acetyltransferase
VISAAKRWLRWPKVHFGGERPEFAVSPDGRPDIGFLADDSRHFELFARWLYAEWSLPRGETLENRRSALRNQMRVDRLPIALVAYWEGNPAGIVSLRQSDLHTRAYVGPWLSALYVDPPFRGRGIGRDLVAATVALAAWLGHREVWLFTTDRRSFYEQLGWERVPPLPAELKQTPPPDVFRHPAAGG